MAPQASSQHNHHYQTAASSTASLVPSHHDHVRTPGGLHASASTTSINTASTHDHLPLSISDKYVLSLDPADLDGPEPDDGLHNPDPLRDYKSDRGGHILTSRGLMNLGCIFILGAGMLTLFAGYPLISYFRKPEQSTMGGFNFGGINATGQIPDIPGNWGLVDKDTPAEFHTKLDYVTGKTWQLVFSDEFNVDGRTFYPGDDPYWEAVDIHYWGTNNLEWYDPSMVTTKNGSLVISLERKASHELEYMGGMMSTWNKFCFTGGLVEAAVILPGYNNVEGLWPAIWAMGNLGRAGYGATLEGMWPYTYDACDVGTAPNQTVNGFPVAATTGNDEGNNGALSFLPGQRLSRCTCPGESHPGPVHENGEYVGRAAPEIDMFEAQIGGIPNQGKVGAVSQSGQWAPFNYKYTWLETPENLFVANETISLLNGYKGGVFQQATSTVSMTNQASYEFNGAEYAIYGFQYKPGFGDAYISWINNGVLAWRLQAAGMAADPIAEISARPVPQEPMYLIMNLGISKNFGFVDFEHLTFPSHLYVDWIRVYQDPDDMNLGCDPADFPTKAYIEEYIEAYTNANLTTWVDDYKQPFPKNKWLGEC